jgi:hypothetical protein
MKEFNLQVSKKVRKFIWTHFIFFHSIDFSLNPKEKNKNLHLEAFKEVDFEVAEEVEEATSEEETEAEEISEEILEEEISEEEIEGVIKVLNK